MACSEVVLEVAGYKVILETVPGETEGDFLSAALTRALCGRDKFADWMDEVAWNWYNGGPTREFPSQCQVCRVRLYPEAYMYDVRSTAFVCTEDCVVPERYIY
jgi:hypothetical protein